MFSFSGYQICLTANSLKQVFQWEDMPSTSKEDPAEVLLRRILHGETEQVLNSASSSDDEMDECTVSKRLMGLKNLIATESEESEDSEMEDDVQVTKSTKTKRVWDKVDFCLYCQVGQKNFCRHMELKHKTEPEVKHIMALKKGSKERRHELGVLRNKGNFLHNENVWKEGTGKIVPRKRPSKKTSEKMASSYLPCEFCRGTFLKHDLWKHQRSCSENNQGAKKRRVQASAKMLLPMSKGASQALKNTVLPRMAFDDVSSIVRNDEEILEYGSRMLQLHQESHQILFVSQQMRNLARLLQEAQKIDDSLVCLKACINPEKFDVLTKAAKQLGGFDEETGLYKTPSFPRNIGFEVSKVATQILAKAIKESNQEVQDMVKQFQNLCKSDWRIYVTASAYYTIAKQTLNKPKLLPIAEDVRKITTFIKSQTKDHKAALFSNCDSTTSWHELCKATLSHTVMFNRRRSGEVEHLLVEQCTSVDKTANVSNDVFECLSNVEQSLLQKMIRIEVRGKRGRVVPILLTEMMFENIKLLNSTRDGAGVSVLNPFVFARPYFDSRLSLKASDCLRKYAIECGAEHPETLRSTKLRKHIATMSQLLSLKENELDMLASFMGHDVRIHREFYRLPESTLQLAKVSKVLIMMEKGQISRFHGKSIDEIDIALESKYSV